MLKHMSCLSVLFVVLVTISACQQTPVNNEDNHTSNKENTGENNTTPKDREIVHKNNELAFQMMDESKHSEDNRTIFLSPVSIYMAISMIYNGADNGTKEEIADVLGMTDSTAEDLNDANLSLLNEWKEDFGEDITFEIANSLWLNQQFTLNKDYEEVIDQFYKGKLSNIDIQDDQAADLINEWVKNNTNEKIDKIVDAPLDDNFVAMLINAVYFHGTWSYPFDKKNTKDGTFYTSNDKETKVPFMHLKEKLDYVKKEDYEGVRLPYGKQERFSMYLFSPKTDGDLSSVRQTLQDEGVENVISEMHQTEGSLAMPKFKIEYEKNLNELLQALGMKQAFHKKEANLSQMLASDDQLYISEVKHKTFLEVNEAGTEAAGSTNAGINTTSAPLDEPFDLTFDHPFVMLIADEDTDAILFLGDMYDISE